MSVSREEFEQVLGLVNELKTQKAEHQALIANLQGTIHGMQNPGTVGAAQVSQRPTYDANMGKQHVPMMFKQGKSDCSRWTRSIQCLLDGHGFKYAHEILHWAKKEKNEITEKEYDDKCVIEHWTDDTQEEHKAMNRLLRNYVELYSDGEANKIIMSVKAEPRNGIEAFRRIMARWDPKTASQAMVFQRDAMKISQAKSHDQIWAKIQEMEDLERQYMEHRPDNQGFDGMTKTCILHQILPERVSEHLLLELRNEDKDPTYEELRKGIISYLQALPGGTIPMVAPVEQASDWWEQQVQQVQSYGENGEWNCCGACGAQCGQGVPEQAEWAGEAAAMKGKGKSRVFMETATTAGSMVTQRVSAP